MKALKDINLKNLVFIDIETARVSKELEMDTPLFDSWEYLKRRNGETDVELQESFIDEAGLFAEFARIVCITVGRVNGSELVVKTYNQEDERELLEAFNTDLTLVTDAQPRTMFCGHAAIGFDIPFIFKRCMVNQVEAHYLLDTAGKKPWEVSDTIIDTKDLWKGTGFRPSSLINIAVALGIPSPKDDISGAEVGDLYWSDEEGRIERISRYCEKDVLTTANVVRRCRFEPLLTMAGGEVKIEEQPLIKKLFDGGKYGASEKAELITLLGTLDEVEREVAFTLLDSITSTARGKKTKITKTHVKALRKEFENE